MGGSRRLLLVVGVLSIRTALALDSGRHITEMAQRSRGNKDGAPVLHRGRGANRRRVSWAGEPLGRIVRVDSPIRGKRSIGVNDLTIWTCEWARRP